MTQFSDLGLSAPILKALAAEGYTTPTPIQAQAIQHVAAGRDIVGLAQTGTGKTAAFALPIIDKLAASRKSPGARAARVLVLAPTRELAAQIDESFRAYGRFAGVTTAVAFGGVPINRQIKALERGVDVLVATPGRLIDLIEQKKCRLDFVEILVLDEADHMLDLGFIHALRRIAQLVPAKRQTVLFSATMPPPIAELAQKFLVDPVQVAVTPTATTAERVEQEVIHVDATRKQDLLHAILGDKSITRALVFTRTKHGADRVVKRLDAAGFNALAIHGNKSQPQRERALEAFKQGRARLLVATEIAARGLDIDCVTHVINFDLPDVPEQYVHRIGRTARAGETGHALSFCAPDERSSLRGIEKLTGQSVPVREHALGLEVREGAPEQRRAPRKQQPQRQQQKPPQRSQPQAKAQARTQAPKPPRERADGPRDSDRRDRKGNEVWSNSGPPPRRRSGR